MKIAVASGKGGTGKTTLSTNLASFAKKRKVVLADLDVKEPNSGLFIQGKLVRKEDKFKMIPEWIEDECTLCGICRRFVITMQLFNSVRSLWSFPNYAMDVMHALNYVQHQLFR